MTPAQRAYAYEYPAWEGAPPAPREEVLFRRELTRVYRLWLPQGGSVVCKEILGPNSLKRFQHERGIMERLAGIAGVPRLAAGEYPAGTIAMEDSSARPLEDLLQQGVKLHECLTICTRLADTVAALHRAGVAHKNIAPGNILLSGSGLAPLLIDYSLATTFAEERPPFVHHNEIAGDLHYLAPEQTGRTGRSVDERADLYALGAVLYRLAAGRPPFQHSDPLQLIHDILGRNPLPPGEVNEALPPLFSAIVMRLLEKEPDARYQSAAGVAHDLKRLLRDPASSFPLGERDFPLRLTPPSRLIGRDREIAALAEVLDGALEGRGAAAFIAGGAGVGKTALVNELRAVVTARRGWFVSGKFDQYRRDPASTATVQALRAVGRLILAEPEERLSSCRERLLAALGQSAGLVAGSLPEFAAVLSVPPELMPDDPVEAQARLFRGALTVLRTVVSPEQPLVMFLDDLQWAGQSSFAFLDDLLSDQELDGFLLVGAYREPEVDATHPLTPLLRRWEALPSVALVLRLQNLPAEGVERLLGEMLRLKHRESAALARAVAPRTGGNPYDTLEFVNALRNDGILRLGGEGWNWDESAVRHYLGSGDVLEVLSQRLASLPEEAAMVLKTVAALGGSVDEGVLSVASGSCGLPGLAAALEDGVLILEQGGGTDGGNALRFRHDRWQQCVYDGMGEKERIGLHLELARRLAPLPHLALLAAEQYLRCLDLLNGLEELRSAALLFWKGAQDAKVTADYAAMERFLRGAIRCCEKEEELRSEPLLALLETAWHNALYSLGRLEEGDRVYRSIEGCSTALELVEAACIQISSLTNRGRQTEGVLLGLALLQRLGFPAPGADEAEIAGGLERLYLWAQGEDADERPEVRDPLVLAAARLLHHMVAPAFFSDPMLCFRVQLQSQRLWMEHGPSASLLIGFAAAPLVTMALRNDFVTGWRIAQRALAIGEARGYELETAWVRHCFALIAAHWGQLLELSVREALLAREGLLRKGDLQFACFTFHPALAAILDSASTLASFREELDRALDFATRTGNTFSHPVFRVSLQLWRALVGETSSLGSLEDPSFDEASFEAEMAGFPLGKAKYHIHRSLCALIFGDDEGLSRHAAQAYPLLPYIEGFYKSALGHLLQALALARRVRGAAGDEREVLIEALAAEKGWLRARAAEIPENFLHLVHFVEAEEHWALGERARAAFSFDEALLAAEQRQRPWHRALIAERGALFFLESGMQRAGRKLMVEARYLYEAWGASGKVQQLDLLFPFLSGAVKQRRSEDGQIGASVSTDSLDLLAVLAASQALSSERSLKGLHTRLEEVLKGATGATAVRLVLWSEEEKGWFVVRSGDAAPIAVKDAGSLIPLAPLRYVQRTREPLLVDDAVHDERFCRDPYLQGMDRCSLMLVPIFSHGAPCALLVLENTLSRGVFSTGRLDAVRLMAGQLAVSLENALLYERLEERVRERTSELSEAQSELLAAARQAGMAEIATNVLHNVGNVLNSVNVSAAVLQRALSEPKGVGLQRAVELIKSRSDDLGAFFTEDPRGRLLPGYLEKLSMAMAEEQEALQGELARLTRSVDHIKEIVSTQQSYAGSSRLIEPVQVAELLEDALRMNAGSLTRHQVTVVKEFAEVPVVPLDKGRVLQILVNLISNAKNAMDAVPDGSHRLILRLDTKGSRLRIQVCDEGEGIAPENLDRVFNHGFTTRKKGHGFGLHSCALAAKEMGGTLTASSAGRGQGAIFTLELPLDHS
ncbi:AAA family ATPase [Geomonas sp. RF6]|uniref:trifunctional serine/threonine-protein kinase/ATP-binding protein/sensor histidine kinase n=1 Tax=Geomonas sp. RF6 TaxID=2897342 RepID=UPI001E288F6A|nr:AAA family ATPase [Geomonas sp. RF6]UFS69886.1 AAA family ATPase [Geomonas sp. RF6]